MIKNVKGVTLTALVITIIVILILAGVTINTTTDLLYDSKLKNKITYLRLVQMTAANLYEKYSFENDTTSLQSGDFSNTLGIYISGTMYVTMCGIDPSETGWFKWNKDILANNGLDVSMLDKDTDYFLVNYEKNEVAISRPYTDKNGDKHYKLSDMLDISN